ncbi:MAG: BT4734/BF3469 family protein [Parabacteroides sp.]|nr:BT4734/BF3469 family protein [Parabacteroides sp.]
MEQQMSYFLPPITNTLPTGNCTLWEVYRWITEDIPLETVTNQLRAFIQEDRVAEYRQLKQKQLPFVTPYGVFSYRKSDALISASGLMVIDIDHLASLRDAEQLRDRLFADPYLDTRLAFVSPSGLGVKLFIPGDDTVQWAMSYIQLLYARTFKGEVDTCGKDISRCCFLSHDSNAKIHTP